MKRSDRVAGLLFLAIVGLLAFDTRRLQVLPVGPGTVPVLVAVLLAIAAVVLVASTFQSGANDEIVSGWPTPSGLINPLFVISAVALYLLALSTIGYLISTFLLVIALLTRLADYSWFRTAALGLIVSVATFLIFEKLGMHLPSWLLEKYLA